jgi:transglutaminase-like putative cysteine protease
MDRESPRWWDWLAACILFTAMLVAVGRLLATNWIPHLDYVWALVSLGVILGLALGKSLFSRRVAVWLAVGYSLIIIPWQLSHATEDAVSWGERLASLGGRLIFSLAQLSSRQPVDDFILFLTFVGILFWIISIISGYALTRHGNILVAVLPGGLAIIILHTYDWAVPERVWYLGTFLFLSFFLYGRINFINSSRDWKERRIFITPEANLDISVAVLISAAALVLLAWTMPLSLSPSPAANRLWNDMVKPWDSMKQRFKDAFAAIQGTAAVGVRDFYSDNLPLGLGNPLGDAVLFTVQVPESARDIPRLYWRGRTYDEYADGNWTTTANSVAEFDPDDEGLDPAGLGYGPQGTFYFTTYIKNQSLLYLLPDPYWISRAGEYKFFPLTDGLIDMVLMRTSRNLKAGESFSARSRLSSPTIVQLRQAGEEYPEWVTERYLQLPEDFSPRVTDLALEITRGAETPYDKATAITNYLRQEIEYADRIPAPPPDTDLLEWFLFDSKKGFCNYYATAGVLMLRAAGVPARLAVGYAEGEQNDEGTAYNVLQKDAHAWMEVYFPEIGWVQFEPTVSESPIVRPEGGSLEGPSGEELAPLTPGEITDNQPERNLGDEDETPLVDHQKDNFRIITWVIITLLAGLAGLYYWQFKFGQTPASQAPVALLAYLERRHLPVPHLLRNWARWSEQTPIARAFAVVNQSLRWLDKPQPAAATPAERAARLRELMPEAGEEIEILATEHQTALYSPREGNFPAARQASTLIRFKMIKRLIKRFFS